MQCRISTTDRPSPNGCQHLPAPWLSWFCSGWRAGGHCVLEDAVWTWWQCGPGVDALGTEWVGLEESHTLQLGVWQCPWSQPGVDSHGSCTCGSRVGEGGMMGWFVGGHRDGSSEGKQEMVELSVPHCGAELGCAGLSCSAGVWYGGQGILGHQRTVGRDQTPASCPTCVAA